MSPKAQNIAIAELLGWQQIIWEKDENSLWPEDIEKLVTTENGYMMPPNSKMANLIPDSNDLNIIHEAEKVLTQDQQLIFWRELDKICQYPRYLFVLSHATAAQRREALLKTLNKWNDSI